MRILTLLGLLILSAPAFSQADASRYFVSGTNFIEDHKYVKAIELIEKAIALDPTGACGTGRKGNAHAELGFAYLKDGDTTKAFHYFDASIALDGKNPFPKQNKASVLAMQGKKLDAYKLLNEIIKDSPNFIDAYVQRGFLLQSDGKSKLAIEDYSKALKLNKKRKTMHAQLEQTLKDKVKALKKAK